MHVKKKTKNFFSMGIGNLGLIQNSLSLKIKQFDAKIEKTE